MRDIVEGLRREMPPVWAGTETNHLTGKALCWGTIQNKRSRGEIPDNCFVKSGKRVLVVRDPFLDWWQSTLSEARSSPTPRVRSSQSAAEAA